MSLRQVVVDTSDGYVDFRFPIVESTPLDGSGVVLRLNGILFQQTVDLIVRIEDGIVANDLFVDEPTIHSTSDGISLSFDGDSGRNFTAALANLYRLPRSSFHMPVTLSCTAVNLEGDPAKIRTEAVKFKLFHETGSTEDEEGPDYFELFLNVDLPSATAELREKDTDFRRGFLNAFPAEPS